MDIAASVRMGLAKRNMSMQDLADALSRRRETISSWCNGHSAPSYNMQVDIAGAFNVTMSEFIKWGE